MPGTESADLTVCGSLSGEDIVSWLANERGLDGWWLCYNADDAVLEAHAASCLAHHLRVDADTLNAAMSECELVARNVRAATRKRLLGGVDMQTERIRIGEDRFSFLWLGAAEPTWSIDDQINGLAPRKSPLVESWRRRSHRAAASTTPAASHAPPPDASASAASAAASGQRTRRATAGRAPPRLAEEASPSKRSRREVFTAADGEGEGGEAEGEAGGEEDIGEEGGEEEEGEEGAGRE